MLYRVAAAYLRHDHCHYMLAVAGSFTFTGTYAGVYDFRQPGLFKEFCRKKKTRIRGDSAVSFRHLYLDLLKGFTHNYNTSLVKAFVLL